MTDFIHCSGGKDSTAMGLLLEEKNPEKNFIWLFADTGMEFPEVYPFLDKLEKHIRGKLVRLKSDKSWDYYFFHIVKVKGKNKGNKGYGFPLMKNRWCTDRLKIRVLKKYVERFTDPVNYIGYAYDELKRAEKSRRRMKGNYVYPLITWKMTERDCLEYLKGRGLLNPIYKYFKRNGCWICPYQSLNDLKMIYLHYPKLWAKIKDYEKRRAEKIRHYKGTDDLEKRWDKSIQEELKS